MPRSKKDAESESEREREKEVGEGCVQIAEQIAEE